MTWIKEALSQKPARIAISAVLGLGMATLFRRVCKDNCLVICTPPPDQITSHVWKSDEVCYRFVKEKAECSSIPVPSIPVDRRAAAIVPLYADGNGNVVARGDETAPGMSLVSRLFAR